MKYKVQLFVGGSTFWFITYAISNQQAEQNARRVYPNATIIHTTATFLINCSIQDAPEGG